MQEEIWTDGVNREVKSAPPLALEALSVAGLDDKISASRPVSGGPPLFITAHEGAFSSFDDALAWMETHRPGLDALILEHGGIVLRDFPIGSSEDFNRVAGTFPLYQRGYKGGAGPRASVTGNVMEATQLGEDMLILLHQEMAYTKKYPPRVAFYCRKPAEVAGETLIADMKDFDDLIPAELRERLERLGSRTIRNCAAEGASRGKRVDDHLDKRGWDDSFQTTDRSEVEQQCVELGLSPVWNDDGSLTLTADLDVFDTHPITGERLYRSYLHSQSWLDRPESRKAVSDLGSEVKPQSQQLFGNGEAFPTEDANLLNRIFAKVTRAWPWQSGDVMILDNFLVAHGRSPYRGTRDVQVALLDHPQGYELHDT